MGGIKVIVALARGEAVREVALTPPGFSAGPLPAADDVCPDGPCSDDDAIAQQAFIITYRDAAGITTERRIRAQGVYEAEGFCYLKAFCLERQAYRSFRVDRIAAVFSGVTGAELGAPAKIFIPTDEPPVPGKSRRKRPRPKRGWNTTRTATRVLMTLARADGVTHPRELEVVRNFVVTALPGAPYGDTDSMIDYAMSLAPAFDRLMDLAARVCEADEDIAAALRLSALALVRIDGEISGDEEVLMDEINTIFRAYNVPGA